MKKLKKHPSTIEIMGTIFTVRYLQVLKDEDGTNLSGDMNGNDRLIRINLSQHSHDEILERTLLHEIIHAVLHMSGQSEILKDSTEEAIVVALENGLSQLYKRK